MLYNTAMPNKPAPVTPALVAPTGEDAASLVIGVDLASSSDLTTSTFLEEIGLLASAGEDDILALPARPDGQLHPEPIALPEPGLAAPLSAQELADYRHELSATPDSTIAQYLGHPLPAAANETIAAIPQLDPALFEITGSACGRFAGRAIVYGTPIDSTAPDGTPYRELELVCPNTGAVVGRVPYPA
jgi:hypothetical protein